MPLAFGYTHRRRDGRGRHDSLMASIAVHHVFRPVMKLSLRWFMLPPSLHIATAITAHRHRTTQSLDVRGPQSQAVRDPNFRSSRPDDSPARPNIFFRETLSYVLSGCLTQRNTN